MDERDLSLGKRILIGNGLVEVEYLTGVKLVLNGPVDYEITGKNSGYLHHGRLVAKITDERGKGFTIDGANGRLIDLGTKFGVSVDLEGDMEVHVLEGVVDAQALDGKKTRLRENEAMRISEDTTQSLEKADVGAFVTLMPPKAGTDPKFVRWSFNEAVGDKCYDTGRGLGLGKASARFQVDFARGRPPERIDGVSENGIYLGGSGYLSTDFKGIEHAGARTVAFWVRVPKDFGKGEGFGIVNWGTYTKRGSAWQVAINSIDKDGPAGRLRIGTYGGAGDRGNRFTRWRVASLRHCDVRRP